jgi:hypothetical protein
MADYIVRKRTGFTFALEGVDTVYTLPALSRLSFAEAELMRKIDEAEDLEKRGKMVKDFILSHAPELEDADIGDMEYFSIFNSYAMSEGKAKMGESSASADS